MTRIYTPCLSCTRSLHPCHHRNIYPPLLPRLLRSGTSHCARLQHRSVHAFRLPTLYYPGGPPSQARRFVFVLASEWSSGQRGGCPASKTGTKEAFLFDPSSRGSRASRYCTSPLGSTTSHDTSSRTRPPGCACGRADGPSKFPNQELWWLERPILSMRVRFARPLAHGAWLAGLGILVRFRTCGWAKVYNYVAG